ncbi:hypothetical protein F511_21816 [Dorcoceras hygrometricum]|uniref:Uncharacterized protein n=1 Tax=Dorcoceras hygrometricum TaxID=472368 RepID=A0A2Z7C8G5_9LAMI|nr:hypothetical protein F511_21816 [Dorcoceras hygrometricum]
MTGRETPSSACTRRPDEIGTDGNSSKSWPEQIPAWEAAAAAIWERREACAFRVRVKCNQESRSRTPQNPPQVLNTLSLVSVRESRVQYLCDPQWFRDTASRGPTTIVAPESQFPTCPSDHDRSDQIVDRSYDEVTVIGMNRMFIRWTGPAPGPMGRFYVLNDFRCKIFKLPLRPGKRDRDPTLRQHEAPPARPPQVRPVPLEPTTTPAASYSARTKGEKEAAHPYATHRACSTSSHGLVDLAILSSSKDHHETVEEPRRIRITPPDEAA